MIYCRYGSTACYTPPPHTVMPSLTKVKAAQTISFLSSQVCDSNNGTQGNGEPKWDEGGQRRKPCSSSGSDSSDRPGDLLEQRATGGRQLSESGGRGWGGGQAGLLGCRPTGGFIGSVSSGHFAVNAEVKICLDSPPSCHAPLFPSNRPCRYGFARQ